MNMKRLTWLFLALAAWLLPGSAAFAQATGAPLTKAQIQQLNFVLSGSWDVQGQFYIPAGTSLPATCVGTAQTLSKRAFVLTTTNTLMACTADSTWTSIGGLPNPFTSNQTFSGIVSFLGLTTFSANVKTVDYLYPGAQPHWLGAFRIPTWVDVPIASSRVDIRSLLFITGSDGWSFAICESKTDLAGCTHAVLKGSTNGIKGDYGYSQTPIYYVDRDGLNQIHVMVQPTDADWMTFRAIVKYMVN
jgi:hypothetical protein